MARAARPRAHRHLASILLLPFNVVVTIPVLLMLRGHALAWGLGAPDLLALGALSGILGVAGLYLVASTVAGFARVGQGTLAPWDATTRLVVVGPYRRVRNPMIAGVLLVLAAEALLLGSLAVLAWLLLFLVGNVLYIRFSEEPGLVKRFGADYERYRQNVPAWVPRLRPWEPDQQCGAPTTRE